MSVDYRKQDRLTVVQDGEEREVFNWVKVYQNHQVRPGMSSSESKILEGDGSTSNEPDAVTSAVAEWIFDEFSVDVEDHGVDVVDPEADGVEVV